MASGVRTQTRTRAILNVANAIGRGFTTGAPTIARNSSGTMSSCFSSGRSCSGSKLRSVTFTVSSTGCSPGRAANDIVRRWSFCDASQRVRPYQAILSWTVTVVENSGDAVRRKDEGHLKPPKGAMREDDFFMSSETMNQILHPDTHRERLRERVAKAKRGRCTNMDRAVHHNILHRRRLPVPETSNCHTPSLL